jgi:hypothetical protein
VGRLLRSLPIGRVPAALWAWRNRREVGRWIGFAWRAVPASTKDRHDVLAEARLRALLAKDPRTRGAPSLVLRVIDGQAVLDGRLPADVHDVVFSLAERTPGVRHVICRIGERRARDIPVPHVHTAGAGRPGAPNAPLVIPRPDRAPAP